jgi:hypothetical protein
VANGRAAVKPVPKPARPAQTDPAPKPVLAAVPEPVREPIAEPVPEAKRQPSLEEKPEPASEAKPQPSLEGASEPVRAPSKTAVREPAAALNELTGAVGKFRALFHRLQDEAGAPQRTKEEAVVSTKAPETSTTEPFPAPWAMPQRVAGPERAPSRPVPQQVVRPERVVPRPVATAVPRRVEAPRPKTASKQQQRARNGAKPQQAPRAPKRRRDPNEKLLRDTVLVLRQLSATMNEMAGALRVAQETQQRRSLFRRSH